MKFNKDDIVIHALTGRKYKILFTPKDCFVIENLNQFAYIYEEFEKKQTVFRWIRSEKEMEDGRFVLSKEKK